MEQQSREAEKPECRNNTEKKEMRYQADCPYPPVCVKEPNFAYGQAMLDNMGGCRSEMSTISLYLYNHFITYHTEEIALCFHKISIVEMHHLEIFGQLARQLGLDPRLWTRQGRRFVYWTPGCSQYAHSLDALLMNSIKGEKAAIDKYRYQAAHIGDCNIVENLKRIILDELIHVDILTELFNAYCTQSKKGADLSDSSADALSL